MNLVYLLATAWKLSQVIAKANITSESMTNTASVLSGLILGQTLLRLWTITETAYHLSRKKR